MARLRALPQVLQASLGPFGVPAAHFRPHIPAVIHITTEPLLPSEDSPSDKDALNAGIASTFSSGNSFLEVTVELPLNSAYHISLQCLKLLAKTSRERTTQVCVADLTYP